MKGLQEYSRKQPEHIPNGKGRRVAIYLRVSTEEQVRKGYSLGEQLIECRNKAIALGASLIEVFSEEGVSGSLDANIRPAFGVLMECFKAKEFDDFITKDPYRYARNQTAQLVASAQIKKSGVTLNFSSIDYQDTPEGNLFFNMLSAIADYDRYKIYANTAAGRAGKARNGKLPMRHEPYGYRYNKETSMLEIKEDEAAVVKRMFELFVYEGKGAAGVAVWLNQQGYPTKLGAPAWSRQVAKQILENHTYCGTAITHKHRYKDVHLNRFYEEKAKPTLRDESEWIPVKVPAIISEDLYERAQALLANARRLHAGIATAPYLLSGLIWCGECNVRMYGRTVQQRWRTYTGRQSRVERPEKCPHAVNADKLESAVWRLVRDAIQNGPNMLSDEEDNVVRRQQTKLLNRIDTDLGKLRGARQRLLRQIELGSIEEEEVAQILLRNRQQIDMLEQQRASVEMSVREVTDQVLWWQSLQQIEQERDLDNMTFEEHKALIRQVVRAIRVYPSGEFTVELALAGGIPECADLSSQWRLRLQDMTFTFGATVSKPRAAFKEGELMPYWSPESLQALPREEYSHQNGSTMVAKEVADEE